MNVKSREFPDFFVINKSLTIQVIITLYAYGMNYQFVLLADVHALTIVIARANLSHLFTGGNF